MVSYEVMHALKRKRRGKQGHMALKLDMSKAYDRIEWAYLRAVLIQMGFDEWWVHLILQCVNSVSYHVIHAKREIGPIIPTRGIRQGDPLSPYLFILCAEGLSALLRKYEDQRWIHGIKVCRQAPSISHMLFADDSYLYCKANEEEAGRLLQLLQSFEHASGQKVNLSKSSVFFSSNVSQDCRQQLCCLLQMREADEGCSYLGLPNMMGISKSTTLGFLKEKVKKKLQSWNGKLISQGGKEVLVKSVVQALPTYAMSVFLLPIEITKEIERSITKFWWNSSCSDKKSIHWMSYNRLSKHKSAGGMGFRVFRDFNIAMLGKQGWRFVTNPHSLVSRVYKARYFPGSSFMEANIGNNPSFIWRSILEAKDLIASGMRWRVGSGDTIKIIGQPWLLDNQNPFITSSSLGLAKENVSAIMNMDRTGWDEDILTDLFNERDQQCIRSITLSEERGQDMIYWSKEHTGMYSVRSAYRLLQAQKGAWSQQDNESFWRKVWRIKAPPKVLNFVWRSLSSCLPTRVMLYQKWVPVERVCPMCGREDETIYHSLVKCPVAAQCWQQVIPEVQEPNEAELYKWWEEVFILCNNEKRAEVATISWALWKARNELVWNKKNTRFNVVIASAKQYLFQWRATQNCLLQTISPYMVEGDGNVVWVKPQMSTIKISVDAATFKEYNASGIGLVVRDSNGSLLQAKTVLIRSLLGPEMGEAMAVKEALSWTKQQQWQQVVVESDCLGVVQLIRSKVQMVSPLGLLVEDCRGLLQELNTTKLFYIKRSANMAAHELARASYSFPDRVFDRSSVPIDVQIVLSQDSG